VPVEAVIDAASAVSAATPRYLATFGPTVDYRSIVTDDLRRAMRHRGQPSSSTRTVFANVSLLVGFAVGEAAAAPSRPHVGGATADVGGPRLSQTARTFVQNVYWRHRQTIVDVILHQVTWRQCQGRARDFSFGGTRPKSGKPRAGWGSRGGDSSRSWRIWGSAVSSLGVRRGAPTAQRFSTIFNIRDGLSTI